MLSPRVDSDLEAGWMYDLEWGAMGLEDMSLEKVDVMGLGGGRTGAAVLELGVLRDWPEWRVSGDWVRRGIDFVEVSAATRGLVIGWGTDAAGGNSVVLAAWDSDGVLLWSLDTVFHGDDDSAGFSHAVLADGVSAAVLAACSDCICCCLLRSFCEILVGCCDLASLAF